MFVPWHFVLCITGGYRSTQGTALAPPNTCTRSRQTQRSEVYFLSISLLLFTIAISVVHPQRSFRFETISGSQSGNANTKRARTSQLHFYGRFLTETVEYFGYSRRVQVLIVTFSRCCPRDSYKMKNLELRDLFGIKCFYIYNIITFILIVVVE